jgi:uncharacterized protein
MAIHIIIDGYNLIRNYPPLRRVEEADFSQGRNFLLEWLSEYRGQRKNPITVIFDGGRGEGLFEERNIYKGIKVLYSRSGQSADEVIKKIAAKEGERALVVTSDRELGLSCRSFQAATIRSEEFAHLIQEKWERSSEGNKMEDAAEDRPKKRKGVSRRLSKKAKREIRHRSQI